MCVLILVYENPAHTNHLISKRGIFCLCLDPIFSVFISQTYCYRISFLEAVPLHNGSAYRRLIVVQYKRRSVSVIHSAVSGVCRTEIHSATAGVERSVLPAFFYGDIFINESHQRIVIVFFYAWSVLFDPAFNLCPLAVTNYNEVDIRHIGIIHIILYRRGYDEDIIDTAGQKYSCHSDEKKKNYIHAFSPPHIFF